MMKISEVKFKEELLSEIQGLPPKKMKEVLDFVCFIKAKETIDPTQTYFWTRKWQDWEGEVDEDKKAGKVLGDGKVDDLLEELKK